MVCFTYKNFPQKMYPQNYSINQKSNQKQYLLFLIHTIENKIIVQLVTIIFIIYSRFYGLSVAEFQLSFLQLKFN